MKNKTKTIGKILSTITLTNIIVALFALTLSFSTTVFAEPKTPLSPAVIAELGKALEDQQKYPCITDTDRTSGNIITFIEEPLSLEPTMSENLESRVCYRSTLRYLTEDGETIITELSKEIANTKTGCSPKAEELANDEQMISVYKISYSCRAIMAILAKGGTSFIEGYVGLIYRWAAGLVGLISVAVIIISSIQISFAGGEAEEVNKAKTRIIKSLAGIAVLFLSGLILYTVNPTFFTR